MTLYGEGEYNLNDLKEIIVTDYFLGLNEDTRECQNEEPLLNCTTRHYMEYISKECGCMPISMILTNKYKVI